MWRRVTARSSACPRANLIVEPLFGNSLAKFDAFKFSWLGSMSRDTALCFTWHTSGIRTLDDAKAHKVLARLDGTGRRHDYFPASLNKLFGTQFEPLIGYPDSGAIGIAMRTARSRAIAASRLPPSNPPGRTWLAEKEVDILAQLTLKPARGASRRAPHHGFRQG